MFAEAATSALVASTARQRPIVSLALAIVAVLLATSVRWLAGDWLGARIPFLTFFPAVLVSTFVGGLWGGAVATVLSTIVAGYLFLEPTSHWMLSVQSGASLFGFVVVAAIIVFVIVLLR
jgi:K+-sensing histidine kinase KdpD